jgi:hypothetical protein
VVVSGQFNYTKGTASMPFILPALLSFQGSAHLFGVGSFSILELKRNRAFTKAVSNMAIMDITDIEPLLMAVYELLQESGIFVFATQHPCFVTLTEKYMTPHSYYDIAIEGQPKEQIYYHRSIQDIFNLCFRAGFVIDGFYEECFKTNKEIPMVMIVRLKKVKRDSLK